MKKGASCLLFVIFLGMSGASLYPQGSTVTKIGEWGTGAYEDVFIQGNYAYCAAYGAGLDVVDISSPANPVKVGNCDTPGLATTVFVSESYAYVADGAGLQIINISNPAAPTITGFYATHGVAAGVFVSGSYAYVAENRESENGLEIINVSNPASPTLAGAYNTPAWAYGVFVSGSYAYVADGTNGLLIVNVSNPAVPTLSGSCDTPGFAYDTFIRGNYAYVADNYNGLQIINISNPAAPTLIGTYDTPVRTEGLFVAGSYAYVADGEGGLQIVNISNPASPTFASSYSTSTDDAYDVFCSGSLAYLADGTGGLRVINVANPASPALAGSLDISGFAYGLCVSGSYGYIADGLRGLRIVNISNPASPALAGSFDAGNALEVFAGGSYAYIGDRNELKIINVTNPASPALVGSFTVTPVGSVTGIQVSGIYAYVAYSGSGSDPYSLRGLKIVNVSNPASPTLTGSYLTYGDASDVHVSGSYAYVTYRQRTDPYASGGLAIVDVSNPASPTLAGSYTPPQDPGGVWVSGAYAYVVIGLGGLQIINVSNPALPTLSGSYDTPGIAYGVFASGSYAYVADGSSGLQIIDVSSPSAPTLGGSFATPGFGYDVMGGGSYAYLADGTSGKLIVLSFRPLTLTSPNGGESWAAGSAHDITWTAQGSLGPMKIEYSTNSGADWTMVSASTENDGSYTWTVPNTPSAACLVRVSDADGSPTDTSDAVFTITAAVSPVITVTSPNGGESWAVGSTRNITWTSSGGVGDVKIEYSTDGGGNYSVITAATANDGTYGWGVPNTPSITCLVRISETDGSPSDTSDATFTIMAGSNSPSHYMVLIEGIWSLAGLGGTWVTEAQITDLTGGSVVSVYFNYGGGNRQGPIVLWTGPAPNNSIKYSNLLAAIDALDPSAYDYFNKVGAVEFMTQDASHKIQVAARILNGDYSKTLPGLSDTPANTADTVNPMMIQNLTSNASYRLNGCFFNPSSSPVTVEFRLMDGNGSQLGSAFSRTLAGYDYQVINPFAAAGVGYPAYSCDNVFLLISPTSGTGRVMAYVSSANNATSDPAAHIAVQHQGSHVNSPSDRQILIEGIWALAGLGGTWVTEAQITDITGGSVVSAYFDYGGGGRQGPVPLWTGPAPHASVKYTNLLAALDALDPSAYDYFNKVGTVEFTTQDSSHKIQVAARILNGNYSKTLPGLNDVPANTADTASQMMIQNLTSNASYRLNCVFFNPSSSAVTVEFFLMGGNGNLIGSSFSRTLAGYDYQVINPFAAAGVSYPAYSWDNVFLLISPTSGAGRVMAYGSSANNTTSDPAAHIAVQYQ